MARTIQRERATDSVAPLGSVHSDNDPRLEAALQAPNLYASLAQVQDVRVLTPPNH